MGLIWNSTQLTAKLYDELRSSILVYGLLDSTSYHTNQKPYLIPITRFATVDPALSTGIVSNRFTHLGKPVKYAPLCGNYSINSIHPVARAEFAAGSSVDVTELDAREIPIRKIIAWSVVDDRKVFEGLDWKTIDWFALRTNYDEYATKELIFPKSDDPNAMIIGRHYDGTYALNLHETYNDSGGFYMQPSFGSLWAPFVQSSTFFKECDIDAVAFISPPDLSEAETPVFC